MNNRIQLKDFSNYTVDVDNAIVYKCDNPLKTFDNGTGYLQIKLYNKGKDTIIYLHHIVYCAKRGCKVLKFKDKLKSKGQAIHHKDDNPLNNTYSNLELVSNMENNYLKRLNGLPFSYITLINNNRYLFSFQKVGYTKQFYQLKDAVRFRNLFLALYFKDDYKEVKRIERKYNKPIRKYLKKFKLIPKYFI